MAEKIITGVLVLTIVTGLGMILYVAYNDAYVTGWNDCDTLWEGWAIEHGWAHHDPKTGTLILHTKEYQEKILREVLNGGHLERLLEQHKGNTGV